MFGSTTVEVRRAARSQKDSELPKKALIWRINTQTMCLLNKNKSAKNRGPFSYTSLVSSQRTFHDVMFDEKDKVTDDFGIIEDSNTEVAIKQVTVFASHYIIALQVVYVEGDLGETKVVHSSNEKYLNSRPDLEKRTLDLERDEYINYISYSISSQTGLIRTLQIETTGGQQLLIEGQIELNNMNNESGQDSDFSSIIGLHKEEKATLVKSYEIPPPGIEYAEKLKTESVKAQTENQSMISPNQKFNNKDAHQGSVLKLEEKVKSLNFVKLNQRVIGFKTKFQGYLKEIDLYTEPCTYHRIK